MIEWLREGLGTNGGGLTRGICACGCRLRFAVKVGGGGAFCQKGIGRVIEVVEEEDEKEGCCESGAELSKMLASMG